MSDEDIHAAGMKVRRRILGDAHVDRAVANTTPLNREFQDLLTRYGWGEIWTRPGFDYRTRRILVLGTMMAIGRWEEFSMHLRRSEEHTSELQSLMRISYAVFCLKKKKNTMVHDKKQTKSTRA